jgi:hypothetical protein
VAHRGGGGGGGGSGGAGPDPAWWAGSQLDSDRLAAFGGVRQVGAGAVAAVPGAVRFAAGIQGCYLASGLLRRSS